jgi:hypothetical protein
VIPALPLEDHTQLVRMYDEEPYRSWQGLLGCGVCNEPTRLPRVWIMSPAGHAECDELCARCFNWAQPILEGGAA